MMKLRILIQIPAIRDYEFINIFTTAFTQDVNDWQNIARWMWEKDFVINDKINDKKSFALNLASNGFSLHSHSIWKKFFPADFCPLYRESTRLFIPFYSEEQTN